jgi:hypothetical protein
VCISGEFDWSELYCTLSILGWSMDSFRSFYCQFDIQMIAWFYSCFIQPANVNYDSQSILFELLDVSYAC